LKTETLNDFEGWNIAKYFGFNATRSKNKNKYVYRIENEQKKPGFWTHG
jgi:hypothetical protein